MNASALPHTFSRYVFFCSDDNPFVIFMVNRECGVDHSCYPVLALAAHIHQRSPTLFIPSLHSWRKQLFIVKAIQLQLRGHLRICKLFSPLVGAALVSGNKGVACIFLIT